jgi:aspartate 1-decarboxylase
MPQRCYLNAKIHHARITHADREYMGSLSIDPELMRLAGVSPFERVDVYNVDNGERLTTYAIEGEPGCICLNGGAALKGEPGQRVIIATYAWLDGSEAEAHVPRVVLVGPGNRPMRDQ